MRLSRHITRDNFWHRLKGLEIYAILSYIDSWRQEECTTSKLREICNHIIGGDWCIFYPPDVDELEKQMEEELSGWLDEDLKIRAREK